jgi:hypothetical protein
MLYVCIRMHVCITYVWTLQTRGMATGSEEACMYTYVCMYNICMYTYVCMYNICMDSSDAGYGNGKRGGVYVYVCMYV